MLDNVTNVAEAASSATAAGSPLLEVAKTWIAYIGVLAAAIIVAFGGIRKALKDLKGDDKPGATNPGGRAGGAEVQRIVGGTIMETTTILLWSESNKAVADALEAMSEKLEQVCRSINYNTDVGRDVVSELKEVRHQIERLRDKLS